MLNGILWCLTQAIIGSTRMIAEEVLKLGFPVAKDLLDSNDYKGLRLSRTNRPVGVWLSEAI